MERFPRRAVEVRFGCGLLQAHVALDLTQQNLDREARLRESTRSILHEEARRPVRDFHLSAGISGASCSFGFGESPLNMRQLRIITGKLVNRIIRNINMRYPPRWTRTASKSNSRTIGDAAVIASRDTQLATTLRSDAAC